MALTALIQTAMPLAGSQEPLLVPIPANQVVQENASQAEVLVEKSFSLETRNANEGVAQTFTDNILLCLHYLNQDTESFKKDKEKVGPENIDWEKVKEPFEVSFVLKPGEYFAFHGNILSEYQDKSLITGNSQFSYQDGYKAVAGLYGNGVCHLASFINWVASEADLEVNSPVNHDFYPIPEVPQEFGTSILYWPDNGRNSANQNLYLKNNFDSPILFTFNFDGEKLELKVQKLAGA